MITFTTRSHWATEFVRTYSLVGVGRDAQGFLQAAAVLVHSQGEVPVALVHGRHPLLDLAGVAVTFVAEAVGQLDEQLDALLGLLEGVGGGQSDKARMRASTRAGRERVRRDPPWR